MDLSGPKRLTEEIKALVPESMEEEAKVIASPEKKFTVWIGETILSFLNQCGSPRLKLKNLAPLLFTENASKSILLI